MDSRARAPILCHRVAVPRLALAVYNLASRECTVPTSLSRALTLIPRGTYVTNQQIFIRRRLGLRA